MVSFVISFAMRIDRLHFGFKGQPQVQTLVLQLCSIVAACVREKKRVSKKMSYIVVGK